ncbi:MAG: response regulator [Spirochaetales bacterium]|nr:response regulator [Spirochaetales bacterium]
MRKISTGLEPHILKTIQGGRVLLVEDSEINQLVATEYLKKAHMDISIASNGEEAVTMVMENSYDLVLMDIQMPVMDGYEACRRIRALADPAQRKVPVVAMTANALTGDREKSLAAGMNHHIAKPIQPAELYSALVSYISPGDRPLPEEYYNSDHGEQQQKNLKLRIRKKFADESRSLLEVLEQAVSHSDSSMIRRSMHTLTGIAGNAGFNEVEALARRIHDSEVVVPEDVSQLRILMNEVWKEIDHTSELTESESSAGITPDLNASETIALLQKTLELLDTDIQEAAASAAGLAGSCLQEVRSNQSVLLEYIEEYDMDKAAEFLSSLLKQTGGE